MSALEHLEMAKKSLNMSTGSSGSCDAKTESKSCGCKAQIESTPSTFDLSQVTDFDNALF